jgi:tetratricopeptide (TPR) repeat protein
MIFIRSRTHIFLLFILFISGCGIQLDQPPEPVKEEPLIQDENDLETETDIAPEVIEEYARIHQISDLKEAETRVRDPEYARNNPYVPTDEDIEFYEREFLEKVYPDFKKLAEKEGFMKARSIYMKNPPAGAGSRRIGSTKYNALIERLATGGGEAASQLMFEDDPAGAHYKEAMRLYNENRLDDAIDEMKKAVRIKPDAPGFLYNLGVMYREKDDYAKAIEYLQKAINYITATGYTRVNLATYADAYVGSHVNLGLIYSRIGMYEDAIKVLKEAIRFRPDDLDANSNLATTYYIMGDMDKASEQMRKLLALDPDNAEAHNISGLLYYRKGLYNAALDEFQIAVKLDPDNKQYSHNLGSVLAELGRDDEANDAFQKASGLEEGEEMRREFAVKLRENKIKKLYNEGHTALESLNINKAIELFQQVLELDPNMMRAHFNLGVAYRMRRNVDKQIYHFGEAVKLNPDMAEAHYNLGLAYSDAKIYGKAIEEFRITTELKPSFKDAHFQLGIALYRTENYEEAVKQFEKCKELSSDWFEAYLNLGSAYLKLENVEKAIKQFKEAIRLKPNSAEAHYSLGEAYVRVEKFSESITLFQKALELDPGHRQARIRLKELEYYQGN